LHKRPFAGEVQGTSQIGTYIQRFHNAKRVLLGDVHEDVRLVRVRRVEYGVQFHARRVIEDGDGLGTDRAGGLHEAEQGVEAHRAIEVVHANADVGEARDGDGSGRCHSAFRSSKASAASREALKAFAVSKDVFAAP
jgi:hypothetical protein